MRYRIPVLVVLVAALASALLISMYLAGGVGKVLVIIPPNNFNDTEFDAVMNALGETGMQAVVACSSSENATGMYGRTVKPDLTLEMVDPLAYRAVVLIGGGGSVVYFDDELVHSIVVRANQAGSVVAAICVAPVILARAGVLEGKSATVFPMYSGELVEAGAVYTGENVTVDGNVITASGPQAAEEFAAEIVKALEARR